MAGRHATGGQTARPGGIRGGQAEPQGNRPITASRPAMRPEAPVLSNQAETSRTAQRMIPRPPMPFENPHGAANVPAPTNRNASHPYGLPAKTLLPKTAGARIEQSLNCGNTETTADMLAAVGEPRMPSGYNPIISGFPTSGAKRQSGRPGNANTNTSRRENARVRQTPGGF
jgi:hypothetical protein